MRDTIGSNIRTRRLQRGLTLAQLADQMFSAPERQSYISLVENGRTVIDVERLEEFAKALECQPSDLLVTITQQEQPA